MDSEDILIVLKNVRRLVPKAYNKRTPNMYLIMDVFGCGSTMAKIMCDDLDVKPLAHDF
jgi:hypothetical protein